MHRSLPLSPRRTAFSLVELSIVLVILGLLVGGVLSGRSLLRAAQIRAGISELNRYRAAVNAFQAKYHAIPGDMVNATDYWGDNATATYGCADAAIADGTPGTCNGDGDGAVVFPASANYTGEAFQFWNQLALAGLIEGSYSGMAGSGSASDSTVGVNVPGSKIKGGGWMVNSLFNFAGSSIVYALDYGNLFLLGATAAGTPPNNPLLTPKEAWDLDMKIDDGKPGRGMVIGRYYNGCSNAAAGAYTNLDSDYAIGTNSAQCALFFIKQF